MKLPIPAGVVSVNQVRPPLPEKIPYGSVRKAMSGQPGKVQNFLLVLKVLTFM